MSLETEVAALTTATTALLGAVNTSKTTLDTAVASAGAHAQTATTQSELATSNGAYQVTLAEGHRIAAEAAKVVAQSSSASATTQAAAATAAAIGASAIVLNVGTLLPAIRPTLNLNFAAAQVVDPRITFTASAATRVNEKGLIETVASGVPRIDYDPVTLACRGLSIWEARTNLLTYSEQFDNAAWTKTRSSITANATLAPDGTTTADTLVENSANETHYIQDGAISTVATTTYTATVYAKAGTRSRLELLVYFGGVPYERGFDLSNGTTFAGTLGGSSATNYSITNAGNGWYRCAITQKTDGTTSSYFRLALNNGSTSLYTGDGTSGLYIWGAQLEAGSSASPYIPTTTAQVTRAADVAVINGANFSSWYNQTEGTFVVSSCSGAIDTSQFPRAFEATDGSSINRIAVNWYSSNLLGYTTVADGVVQSAFDPPQSVIAKNTPTKLAIAYKSNDFAAAVSGGTVGTDTDGTVPAVTQLYIGTDSSQTGQLNGWIESLTYYPKRLTNAELQALSFQ